MIIAMPVYEKSTESNIFPSFGRAPYFLVYDTEIKESSFIDNSAAASQGGAGIKAAQTIIDNKVNVLLTLMCGQNAADVLKAADIEIYKADTCTASYNINAFIDGKLSILNDIHAGFHNHGNN